MSASATSSTTNSSTTSQEPPSDLAGRVPGSRVEQPVPAQPDPAGRVPRSDGLRGLRRRLVVCTIVGPVVLLPAAVPVLSFQGWQWWALGLTTLIVAWGASPFHREAWAYLRRGEATTSTLVSASTAAALSWSLAVILRGDATTPEAPAAAAVASTLVSNGWALYLPAAAILTWLALAARYALRRSFATDRRSQDHMTEVGTTTAGAERSGSEQSWTQSTGEGVLAVLALLAAVTAAAGVGFWLAAGASPRAAAGAAATVLVLACSGGLVWARPLVVALGARRGGQEGFRAADQRTLAASQQVTTVVIGAGSLTTDHPSVLDVATAEGTAVPEVLERVGALGAKSKHPVIRAVVATAQSHQIGLGHAEMVVDSGGLGLRGIVDGQTVAVGSESFLGSWGHDLPRHLSRTKAAAESAGRTTLLVGWDGAVRALVILTEPVRPNAREAVAQLRSTGHRPVLLADSDERDRSAALAGRVGIDEVVVVEDAEGTGSALDWLGRRDGMLALVGGGHGEASGSGGADLEISEREPSLSRAGQGVPDLWSAVDALRFCQAMGGIVRQNRLLAFACALPTLVLAAAGYIDAGWAVPIMVGSIVPVALNSWRINRFRSLRPPCHKSS